MTPTEQAPDPAAAGSGDGAEDHHWFEALANRMGPAYLRYAFTKGTTQEVEFITGRLNLAPGSVVLDLGCGPGRHAHELARRGLAVVGLDVARKFLEVGRDGGHVADAVPPAVATPSAGAALRAGVPPSAGAAPVDSAVPVCGWVRADAAVLPIATASVDAVVSLCQGAFGSPPLGSDDSTDSVIVNEAARVLRPGGYLVLSAFSAYFQLRWLEQGDTFDAELGRNHEHTTVHDEHGTPYPAELWTSCYTPRELRLLAAAAGLEVVAVWSVAPGDYSQRPPDLAHPELLMVARRR
jgi:SAM-dependent methyltransferase